MPITIGALRKQRLDKRRSGVNSRVRRVVREAVSAMRKKPAQKTLTTAFSALDKASKSGVIHRNKAARLKSRLSKLMGKK